MKRLDKEARELYQKIKSEYYLRTQEDMAVGLAVEHLRMQNASTTAFEQTIMTTAPAQEDSTSAFEQKQ